MRYNHLAQAEKVPRRTRQEKPIQQTTKTVPFDYVVTLELKGIRDRIVQNVINVSVEGYFVATAISYSLLIDERKVPREFGAVEPGNPDVFRMSISPSATILSSELDPNDDTRLIVEIKIFGEPKAEVLIYDDNRVISGPHKLEDNGQLTTSISLTIGYRCILIIRDLTNNLSSSEISFIPGSGSIPVPPQFGPQKPFSGRSEFNIVGTPGATINIFIFKKGINQPIQESDQTIPTSAEEAGLVKVTLTEKFEAGDIVLIRYLFDKDKANSVFQIPDKVTDFTLSSIPLKYLKQGFRLNPTVFQRLENEVPIPPEELENPFQPCGILPEYLSFLYTIIDNGTGRELQSEPIHNIAGLGIANGDRPFRVFPKPIVFAPRTVIQFQVQEITGGPGTLYIVLQGYKILGTGRLPLGE